MVVRIVPQAFVSDDFLIGPGRHDFGSAVHSWSVDGQTLPDDPSLDLPASYVQVITPEMGVAGALNRLAAKIGHVGPPPITLKSLGYLAAAVLDRILTKHWGRARDFRRRVMAEDTPDISLTSAGAAAGRTNQTPPASQLPA